MTKMRFKKPEIQSRIFLSIYFLIGVWLAANRSSVSCCARGDIFREPEFTVANSGERLRSGYGRVREGGTAQELQARFRGDAVPPPKDV